MHYSSGPSLRSSPSRDPMVSVLAPRSVGRAPRAGIVCAKIPAALTASRLQRIVAGWSFSSVTLGATAPGESAAKLRGWQTQGRSALFPGLRVQEVGGQRRARSPKGVSALSAASRPRQLPDNKTRGGEIGKRGRGKSR